MKEVERVSIGGYAFTLDKDASMEADRYLKELESHYLAQEGGREIMEGIEERMAGPLRKGRRMHCRGHPVSYRRDRPSRTDRGG